MIARAQRLRAAYGALDRDQRFAAAAAIWLLLAMFLPWYEKNVVIAGTKTFASDSISAFGAVSFVEAAIFLVAAGVIGLLLIRADGRPFHLPGGDGTIIFAAGLWATALIFYRVFDRPNVSGEGGTVGIQWGFFVAFVAAGAVALAGQRIRATGRPEPRNPAADDWDESPRPTRRERPPREQAPREPRTTQPPRESAPTAVVPRSEARTEVARGQSRRDRAVTREDARRLTFDEPGDEPPTRPDDAPRACDDGR